jgi:hypothetical protein
MGIPGHCRWGSTYAECSPTMHTGIPICCTWSLPYTECGNSSPATVCWGSSRLCIGTHIYCVWEVRVCCDAECGMSQLLYMGMQRTCSPRPKIIYTNGHATLRVFENVVLRMGSSHEFKTFEQTWTSLNWLAYLWMCLETCLNTRAWWWPVEIE